MVDITVLPLRVVTTSTTTCTNRLFVHAAFVLLLLLLAVQQQNLLLEAVVAFPVHFTTITSRTTTTGSTSTGKICAPTQQQKQQRPQHHNHQSLCFTASPRQRSKGTWELKFSLITSTTGVNATNSNDNSNNEASSLQSQSPTYGLYEVQEEMLIQRGMYEEELMSQTQSTPLLYIEPPTTTQKRNSNSASTAAKGFGSPSSPTTTTSRRKTSKPAATNDDAKHYASILRADGLVRIDNIIPHNIIDELREFVLKLRQEATEQVQQPQGSNSLRESPFADVLLRQHRCDLKMPIGYNDTVKTPVVSALYHALCVSPVAETIAHVYRSNSVDTMISNTKKQSTKVPVVNKKGNDDIDSDAVLYELSCLISDYGSHRQVIHPDNPFRVTTSGITINNDSDRGGNEKPTTTGIATVPTLLTCFIALQDILNVEMGPTIFLPNTHTQSAHELFAQDTLPRSTSTPTPEQFLSPKDILLRDSPSVMGTLTKG
jgi:hypothetical protein